MKTKPTLSVLWLAWVGVATLHAQPAAVQQFQNTQLTQPQPIVLTNLTIGTAAPELYRGENVDVGPQRILRLKPRPHYFDLLLDSQGFCTDNANFAQAPVMIAAPFS